MTGGKDLIMNIENLTARGNRIEEQIFNKNYVLSHVVPAMRKRNVRTHDDYDILTRSFLNLDVYLKVYLEEQDGRSVSFKISSDYIRRMGLNEEEIWNCAKENIAGKFSIRNMSEILNFGECSSELYVLSTNTGNDGAAGILFRWIFEEFCKTMNCESCFILPSSTEELILLTENSICGQTLTDLAEMVNDINRSVVEESLQLSPVVYSFQVGSDIRIVAEA